MQYSTSGVATKDAAASILTQQLAQMGIFDEETMAAFKNIAQSAFERLSSSEDTSD
ncbi:hypothetical protein [Ruminiclostridium hungatei]|uniref:hypothetical protein n=1 Tax=Ruminiclostridium hungatei TaxID=48256 RepID=UPI0013FDEA75|nr:hypothetical protein [Ruminiclostridium hungatei]